MLLVSLFTLVELNCENLFDCRHDSLKQDMEFTPDGSRRWTERKYWNKLNNISKTIISCGMEGDEWKMPDIVALCEIENDSVMRDLTKRSSLRTARYEYIATQSEDVRGIDVALLYSPGTFFPISNYPLRVKPEADMRPTRDILYVSGRIVTGDTIHVFVVHAPSRYGGEKRTRSHRLLVAERLISSIDSLREVCNEPKIIVTGDFNDYSDSPSLLRLRDKGLTSVSQKAIGRTNGVEGTYKYKGEWESLDHILLSKETIPWKYSCFINDDEFLLEKDDRYNGYQPYRTFRGYKYRNAYSDHLPLVIRFDLSSE